MGNLTLEEAKKFFFEYDCSLFMMGRENPTIYAQYMNLNVDKKTENNWRFEKLTLLYKSVENDTRSKRIGVVFNKMYDQVKCINTSASLELMLKTIEFVNDKLVDLDKLMIVETILGKKDIKFRSGLIYQSFDNKEIKKSILFAKYTKQMLEQVSSNDGFLIRTKTDKKKYQEILIDLSITNQQIDNVKSSQDKLSK